MPLAVSSWITPWSPVAYMVDASLTGYGIQSANLGSQTVGSIGRVRERSRWRLGAEQARACSLEAAGYALNEDGELERDEHGNLIKLNSELLDQIHRNRWESNDEFPEIPAKCLNKDLWRRVQFGRFLFKDAIHNLEARALVKTSDRLGNVKSFYILKVLLIGDNLAVTLAFARRRARDFKLLIQTRRLCSIGLCRNVRF